MPTKELYLVKQGSAAKIYVDPKGKDYEGLRRVAQSFAADVKQVTEVEPEIYTQLNKLDGTVIIAGSIGSNDFIDDLIAEGTVNVSAIQNKRECYKIQVVEQPTAGVDKALVIVGSDKRGRFTGCIRSPKRLELVLGCTGRILCRRRSRHCPFLITSFM